MQPYKRSLDHPRLQELLQSSTEKAHAKVSQMFENSKLYSLTMPHSLPSFQMSELTLGTELGKGEFCVVQLISKIELSPHHESSNSLENKIFSANLNIDDDVESRNIMKENYYNGMRKGEEYVVKRLSNTVKSNASLFQRGIIDLTVETKILSAISHPNIIKLRGFDKQALFRPSYFIMLERLYFTLNDKMEEWNNGKKIRKRISRVFVRNSVKKMLIEKLEIAASLSSALAYLHTLRIVHRDLKPDNIGFDYNNDLKIFDFGLANELRQENRVPNGLYKMTGNTGSKRYMAPEVAREEPYNHSVDIYSLGILLWEMIAKKKAFEGYTLETHDILVVQIGERPPIDSSWSTPISELIQKCWDHDYRKRPNTDNLHITIKTLIDSL